MNDEMKNDTKYTIILFLLFIGWIGILIYHVEILAEITLFGSIVQIVFLLLACAILIKNYFERKRK